MLPSMVYSLSEAILKFHYTMNNILTIQIANITSLMLGML